MGGFCSFNPSPENDESSNGVLIADNGSQKVIPSSIKDIENLAAKLCEIARAAGSVELEIYEKNSKDVQVQMKVDEYGYKSPLTEADEKATEIISLMLHDFDENIPIVIEEKEMEEYKKRKDYEFFWCVDPLDGTKEFLKRNGQFTVNIGLIRKNTPVFGVVYVPTSDTIYYGGTLGNYGSWKLTSKDGKPINIQSATFSRTDENLNIVASNSHINQATREFIDQFNNPRLKCMGSSLKLLLVAEGAAHCYPRLNPTREWDTAAAHAIVNAAGGRVVIADVIYEFYENGQPRGLIKNPDGGKPLRYNKESSLNPYFIVWGKLRQESSET